MIVFGIDLGIIFICVLGIVLSLLGIAHLFNIGFDYPINLEDEE